MLIVDKPEIQAFADKVASIFVPFVLAVSALTFTVWMGVLSFDVGKDWPFRDNMSPLTFSILNSISVLVIACPCALGLATPTALMVGSGVAASLGILIKSGEALESAQQVDTVVFDKTGTLTHGKPSVTDVFLLPSSERSTADECPPATKTEDEFEMSRELRVISEESRNRTEDNPEEVSRLLLLCASAEKGSEHPIAKGVIAKATSLGHSEATLLEVSDFHNMAGVGLECVVDGKGIALGNGRMLDGKEGEAYAKKVMELLEHEVGIRCFVILFRL